MMEPLNTPNRHDTLTSGNIVFTIYFAARAGLRVFTSKETKTFFPTKQTENVDLSNYVCDQSGGVKHTQLY